MLYLEDIYAFIFSLLFVSGVVFLSKILVKKKVVSRNTVREFTHIAMGSWGFLWFLFKTHLAAILLTVLVTLFIIFAPKSFRATYSGGEEKHIGLIFYSVMFTLITIFFWKTRAGSLAIFSLAFSDGFAGLIGKKFGKHEIKLAWSQKRSLEGFIASFIATLFSWLFAWFIYRGYFGLLEMFIFAMLISVVELISPPHTDNILIPVVALVYAVLFV